MERLILSPDIRINSYSLVEDSILFDRVEVGRNAKIRRAIIDKDVKIPAGFSVGYRLEDDAKRFMVTESGVVVIAKGELIEEDACQVPDCVAAGRPYGYENSILTHCRLLPQFSS